jgi:hypothetical protein
VCTIRDAAPTTSTVPLDPTLPPCSQGDLEALKEAIKINQHEIFCATLWLDALANLYQGLLESLLPLLSLSRPEQMQSNPPKKATAVTMSSGGSFNAVPLSRFSDDSRHILAHLHSPVQTVPLASSGPHPGISGNNMVCCLHCRFCAPSHMCWISPMPHSTCPSLSLGPYLQSIQWPYTCDAVPSLLQVFLN